MIGQHLLAVLERGVLELILGRTLECVGEGLERLGHGGIEHQVGVGDVLLGAAGTELELVAGEGKRGGAVAVGVVLHQLGQGIGAQVEHAARGMDGSLAIDDLLDDLGKLVAQEDGHNRRRSLVGAQTMVVAGRGNGGTQELLIVIDGLDHRGEEDDELQVVERGVARIEQILGLGAKRPVVVLARTVDALKGLLVQQADQVVAGGDELHLLHHDQILVDGLVDLAIDRCELMLAGSNLVVLGLGGNAKRPQFIVQVLHIGRDGGADSAKVVLLELLALAGSGTKEGAAGDDQVLALAIGVLLDQEVLLLVAHGRNDLLGGLAKQRQNALRLTRERGHGTQQRGLLVQGLARVGAESRGDAQDIVLNECGAGGIPSGVATGLEGGTQAAVGEAGGVRLALDEVLARKLGNGGAVVVGLQEAVVLLGSNARKRLEPVRVVRRALGDGPDLHGMGDGVGHIQVERLTALEGCSKALPNVLGEVVLHDFLREHHGPEAVSKFGHTELPSYRHRVRSGVDY